MKDVTNQESFEKSFLSIHFLHSNPSYTLLPLKVENETIKTLSYNLPYIDDKILGIESGFRLIHGSSRLLE